MDERSTKPLDAAPSPESERSLLREAVRQQRILSEVSRILLDYTGEDEHEPLRRIVAKVVDAMGDWCVFSMIQPDGLTKNVAAHHPDPRQRELEARLNKVVPPQRWDAGPPEYNALLLKRPIVIEQVTDEMLRLNQPSEEAFALYQEIGLSSLIVAPMFIGQEPLGTLLLASTGKGGRRYTQNDIDFVFSLAGRAALAVRNARLLRALKHERREAELRAAELLAVLQSSPTGISIYGPDDRLRFASPSMDALLGFPLSHEIGRPVGDLSRDALVPQPSGDREDGARFYAELFADRARVLRDELVLEGPPQRILLRTSTPVTDQQGAYLGRLFVLVDVTSERELDRKRAEFLTVAAHELRTPLTPLSMYLQTIERRLGRDQPVNPELLAKASRQVTRLEKLVQDLLDVSRIDSGRIELRRERVALDELAAEVAGDFRATARQHELVLRAPKEPVHVDGDRERLEQVLVNLVQNAIKYSPRGGRIVISVEPVGKEAQVSVQDPGIGVPPEEQSHLFQRFFRARNAASSNYGGLGIGLYVSHEIVRRHGGVFAVESELGKGATFSFRLPLAGAAGATSPRGRILLVDDDPDILEATGGFLLEEGYLVDQARDGRTALELVRTHAPDLMLIDLAMPVLDGWALIEKLRAEKLAPAAPVVVFSADGEVREKAAKLKADATLRKPFSLDDLHDLVEQLLSQRRSANLAKLSYRLSGNSAGKRRREIDHLA